MTTRSNAWIHRGLAAALAAGLLAFAAPSWAESQLGVVLAKDEARRTLTVDPVGVVHVNASTVIKGVEGQRMRFEELPTAREFEGGYEVDGDESIRFESVRVGSKRVATEIQLLEGMLD